MVKIDRYKDLHRHFEKHQVFTMNINEIMILLQISKPTALSLMKEFPNRFSEWNFIESIDRMNPSMLKKDEDPLLRGYRYYFNILKILLNRKKVISVNDVMTYLDLYPDRWSRVSKQACFQTEIPGDSKFVEKVYNASGRLIKVNIDYRGFFHDVMKYFQAENQSQVTISILGNNIVILRLVEGEELII